MLLSKSCKWLQQDQRCLRNGSFCDPYCIKMRYPGPDEPDSPEEELLMQGLPEVVWFEKK